MSVKRLSVATSSNSLAEAAAPIGGGGGCGVQLTFENITFTAKDRRTGAPIKILSGISGRVDPNRLMVIMGSSGAGKTTLLDVLACNLFGAGAVGGEVRVNGEPRRRSTFQHIASYVMQRDVLLASSTVREALMLAALLKLPRGMGAAEKEARVDGVIAELDLAACQHTLIGDEALQLKGISGGQRRRVSVGIELVKDPRLLFLDEPTSGLDSEMAASLVDTLGKLARQNRTVCMTIHQPNSYIASRFDDFLLLHAGACVYQGPWAGAAPHFAALGAPCPPAWNPTDFFMSVLRDRGDELHAGKELAALEAGAPSAPSSASSAGDAQDARAVEAAPSSPWWYQVWVLSGRMLRMWWRNPAMLFAELTQYLFMGLFVGLVYLQLSHSLATGVSDRAASIWFAMAILSFTPSYTAAVNWDKDRLLLRRESQQGMYSVGAWFAARTATTWPVEALQTLLFCAVAYWMVGYAPSLWAFLIFTAAFCLFQLTSETVGTACAVLTGNSTFAVLVLTFVLLFLLSFSGFLVSAVPVYFRWISKISYLTYAFAAVLGNELGRVTFYTADGTPVPGSAIYNGQLPDAAFASIAQVNNGLSVGANMAVLLGITLGTRALCFALVFLMAKLKRL